MHFAQKFAFHALALTALCASALTARAQDEDDIVKKADKTTVAGKIETEDLKGISIKTAGGKATIGIDWKGIKSIQYAGSPELKKARSLVEQGNMREALPLLEDLRKKSGDLKPHLKLHVLNLLGGTYLRVGETDKAIETYTELFKVAPKSQFVVQGGGENLINAYLAKGNNAGAQSALQLLFDGMKAAGQDTTPLNPLRGRVQEASGDFASAAATYNQVLSAASADAEAKAAAELGVARCLWGQKKGGEAEAKYKALTSKDGTPGLVLAGAWNGLGDIMMDAGRSKSDANLITDALFAYLRGCVLYVPAAGESTNEYERSVFGAANCFKALGEIETNADKKKLCAQRARERMDHLQTKFPGSPYLAGTK